jgi:hypothetical protein
MRHVFLVSYKNRKTGEVTWSTQLGIRATRLMAVRKGTFSYLDDSPRIMSDEEQQKIYGEVAHDRIRAITILRDEKTGAVVRGYAHWMLSDEPKGMEKGNTKANMAFKRSEAQALDRLRPGEMPSGVDVVDEQYEPPTQITEIKAEATQIEQPPAVVDVDADGFPTSEQIRADLAADMTTMPALIEQYDEINRLAAVAAISEQQLEDRAHKRYGKRHSELSQGEAAETIDALAKRIPAAK